MRGNITPARSHGITLGGTNFDARDMNRMGKKQELRVSYYLFIRLSELKDITEKFSNDIHHWFRCRPSMYMGERLAVRTLERGLQD
jgi:hypothetical protein